MPNENTVGHQCRPDNAEDDNDDGNADVVMIIKMMTMTTLMIPMTMTMMILMILMTMQEEEESFFARSVYHNFLLRSDNLVIFLFLLFL